MCNNTVLGISQPAHPLEMCSASRCQGIRRRACEHTIEKTIHLYNPVLLLLTLFHLYIHINIYIAEFHRTLLVGAHSLANDLECT